MTSSARPRASVVATRLLCNPVRKNNGRILNGHAHLVCYEATDVGTVPFQPRDVRVSNQFGVRRLSAVRPVALCVPSLKRKGAGTAPTGANPTLVLDHFRCYDVKPQAAARTVKLVDQFKTTKSEGLCGSCGCATPCARTTSRCGARRRTSSATRSPSRRSSRWR